MDMVNAKPGTQKKSYTIPCATSFRDRVLALATIKGVNAGDLARSIVLVVDAETIDAYADPGGPEKKDRETVVLKSGTAKGRPWRRKPRLQVRLMPGLKVETIRRALAIALDIDAGTCAIRIDDGRAIAVVDTEAETAMKDELERLRAIVNVLQFTPVPGGVHTRNDALYVLGFAAEQRPDNHTVRNRFRMLATIHHPDGEHGDHERMSQLNAAMDVLKRGA